MRQLLKIEDRPGTIMNLTNEGYPDYNATIKDREPKNGFLFKCEMKNCNKKVAVIDIYKENGEIRISSALRSFAIKTEHLEDIIQAFQKKDFNFIHHYLVICNGLDGYCPDCNKIYCDDHWTFYPNHDDGFYDDTKGICIKGHKRIVDD